MTRPERRTHIVVPCFNEALRLACAPFRAFVAQESGVTFSFVDDGSTDATWERICAMESAAGGEVTGLRLERNVGKGEAVRQGMLAAFARSSWDYVGYWDADLSTPLTEIPGFLDLLDANPRYRCIFGSRVRLLGRFIERRAMRHYLGRVFATAASLTLNIGVYDTQCGAKIFRATPDTHDLFAEPFCSRWVFDVEIVARMIRQANRNGGPPVEELIYELPLRRWEHVEGSKVGPVDFVRSLWELAKIRRKYFTGRPLQAP